MKKHFLTIAVFGMTMFSLTSCRNDDPVSGPEDNIVESPTADSEIIKGMYILCEGNMGANKATIDYLDLSNADGMTHYIRNIYPSRNPSVVMELGDMGNDMQIYGSKLWIVVNGSNKVEVCAAESCKRIGQIDIPNCRYLAFDGGHAYVSSYAGPTQMNSMQLGWVYKVDTLTLQKVDSVTVGRQPEEMEVIDGKLYVANSGGYTPDNYDNTVSVIDLATMKEERKIEVATNLHRLRKDSLGQLWATSRGNYYDISPQICCLSMDATNQMNVCKRIYIPASNICIVGDSLYYVGTSYSNTTQSMTKHIGLIDVRKHEQIATSIFSAQEINDIQTPYGIIVNPQTKDFFLMDAKNYTSSGELLHFHSDGRFAWRQQTGEMPSKAVFLYP